MATPFQGNEKIINALRLSERQSDALLEQLQQEGQNFCGGERRIDERVSYTEQDLLVKLHHPGGSTVNCRILPRNLSRSGVGFLHGNYVHLGTRCVLPIRNRAGIVVPISGSVVQCRHVRGNVHEIGVRFDKPIDLSEFLNVQADQGQAPGVADQADRPRFQGAVLLLCSAVDQRDLLHFQLSGLGLSVQAVAGADEAAQAVKDKPPRVVIADVTALPDDDPGPAPGLQRQGFQGTFIAVTADDRPEALERTRAKGFAHVLALPLDETALAQLLASLLPPVLELDGDTRGIEPLVSSKWSDVKMRPLILAFITNLRQTVEHLAATLCDAGQASAAHNALRSLKVCGAGYGYAQVSQVAGELLNLSLQSAPPEALQGKLRELARLSQAAGLVQAKVPA